MLVCVLIGYMPQPEYLIELTCISNTLGGLVLIADGVLNLTAKKCVPNVCYQNVAVSILTVFLVCMGSLTGIYKFNFKGAFFFLHVVTPIIFVVCYMLFCDENTRSIPYALTAPIMGMAYLLFDYLRCQFTGQFVYGFFAPEAFTLFNAAVTGVISYVFFSLLGLSLFALNRLVAKKAPGSFRFNKRTYDAAETICEKHQKNL